MMWFIASIPFWLLGVFLASAGIAAIPLRQSDETMEEVLMQMVVGLSAGGCLLVIAAKVAS